ncbi:T9SS type A sorting domain-containing protein [Flavivirga aquimarina]|uniref:T9SS type A sorting domain-containing protein n=1 Tax=Flavivirga aquimarina TaxID=2027862 RepID=A0ABT8WEI5_9FLAO|nr:T9SS type A sorting domain-containing protein [Flavivirga aquimarina]MDO5971467.1 T9SS type A sorting domain-containing protein [Flavivirga aquimarina]
MLGSGEGVFSDALGSLSSNTIYYVRSYAINSSGISYGNVSTIDTSTLSDINIGLKAKIKVYPSPSTHYISISGLTETKNYKIYNVLGKEVSQGNVTNHDKIDINFLNKGWYFIKAENLEMVKFIKK